MNILQSILDNDAEASYLRADGFDDAVIGVDHQSERLIYSVNKCIDILMEGGMTDEEAEDYFSFNVECAYVGEKTPIWCEDRF